MGPGPRGERRRQQDRIGEANQAPQPGHAISDHDQAPGPGAFFQLQDTAHGCLVVRIATKSKAVFSGVGDHPAVGNSAGCNRAIIG